MKNYSVSVIVPVYGVEKYIDKCLKSLVSQTLKDIEIIVVNDGSKDNSQKIIDDYAKKYKILTPIAWIHHFCVWAFSSDYAIKDKMKFATSAMSISQKRNNLIKKLEL